MLTQERYTRKELSAELGAHVEKIRYWERAKGLVPVKENGHVYYTKEAVESFLENNPKEVLKLPVKNGCNVITKGRLYICMKCKGQVIYKANYCHTCGTKLIFEE